MALSEKLRQAQARRARAEERPRYLQRVLECTGRVLRDEDLLGDDELGALSARHRELLDKTRTEGTERRTPALSASEARDFANRLIRAMDDRVMIVGCAGPCPALARIPLHEVLGALAQYMEISGFVGMSTEDGDSNLAIDRLMPDDPDNRFPEGSYEFVLRGPLFDGVNLPGLFAVGAETRPG